MIEFDRHHRTLNAVIENAVVLQPANPHEPRLAEMRGDLFQSDLSMAVAHPTGVNLDQVQQTGPLCWRERLRRHAGVRQDNVVAKRRGLDPAVHALLSKLPNRKLALCPGEIAYELEPAAL